MAENVGGIEATVGVVGDPSGPALEKLKREMENVEVKMRILTRSFAEGEMVADVYARKMGVLDATHRQYARTVESLTLGSGEAAKSTRNLGNTILFASNAFQDFSAAGMLGVTNNIPQIVMALGFGSGLAGVLMVAGMGVQVLTKHWHEFTEAMGLGAVETATQEMERLGKATHKTAEETERLDKLKSREATHKEVVESKTEDEKAVESAMKKAIAESGGRDVMKQLLAKEKPFHNMNQDDLDAIATAKTRDQAIEQERRDQGWADPIKLGIRKSKGTEAEVRKKIEDRLAVENTEAVNTLLDDAIKGTGDVAAQARKTILDTVKSNPGAFKPGTASRLEAAHPGMLKELEAIDEGNKREETNYAEGLAAIRNAETDRKFEERWKEEFDSPYGGDGIDPERDYEKKKKEEKEKDRVLATMVARGKDAEDEDKRERKFQLEHTGFEAEGRKNTRNFQKEKVEDLIKDTPGFGELSERFYAKALGDTGMDSEKARAKLESQIKADLVKGGATPEAALSKAFALSKDISRSVNEDIMGNVLNPEIRNSQQMGIEQVNRNAQAAISNDNPQVRNLEDMKKYLAKILENTSRMNFPMPRRKM